MTIENAINLLHARADETIDLVNTVIEAVAGWSELAANPQNVHLIQFHRLNQMTHEATNALYRLENHVMQYRKLAASSGIPTLARS
jgi:hypothetical protein